MKTSRRTEDECGLTLVHCPVTLVLVDQLSMTLLGWMNLDKSVC